MNGMEEALLVLSLPIYRVCNPEREDPTPKSLYLFICIIFLCAISGIHNCIAMCRGSMFIKALSCTMCTKCCSVFSPYKLIAIYIDVISSKLMTCFYQILFLLKYYYDYHVVYGVIYIFLCSDFNISSDRFTTIFLFLKML